MRKRSKEPDQTSRLWHSYLEDKPEYVRAIGMVSIENGNLETALADLLGAVLAIRGDVARAIFFAPRAAILRIEILEAATETRLRPKGPQDKFHENESRKAEALRKIRSLIGKAKAAVGQRHNVMHDTWGIEIETSEVFRAKVSDHLHGEPAPLAELHELIKRYRLAIMTAHDLYREFTKHPPMMVDMRPEPPDKSAQ
jgi:hypothetical protein